VSDSAGDALGGGRAAGGSGLAIASVAKAGGIGRVSRKNRAENRSARAFLAFLVSLFSRCARFPCRGYSQQRRFFGADRQWSVRP